MEKEKIVRPESRHIKELVQFAGRIDTRLGEIVNDEASLRDQAQSAAQAFYEERVRLTLEQMEVEHLNKAKQGIRTNLLRDAGVENVYQASQLSYEEICDIEGLGDQSAEKILQTITQIVDNTKRTARIRIDAEHPGEAETALICSLYRLIRCRPLRKQCDSLYQSSHRPLGSEIKLAKEGTNPLTWLFKSKARKQQIVEAVESLETRLSGPFGDGVLLGRYDGILNADQTICWNDYRADASTYMAELEYLGLNWVKTSQTPAGLPEELVHQIQNHTLDLQYLKATLRSYQTFGTQYIVHQGKTLLGDEMGLGKTVQAIAAMAVLKAEGKTHFMVVCPASVLINWCREIEKFSHLAVTKVHGNDEEALRHWRENGDVCVTTYESISRFQLPETFPISMIVTDEAHYVKNQETIRAKALKKLLKQTEYVLFMSGTPLENRVEEMCSLISLLRKDIADSLESVKYISTAEQFRQELAPVYLRRTREDVLTELPELTEKEQWCILKNQEKKDYKEAVKSGNFMAIRQVSWQTAELSESSKAARLLELCQQAMEQNRKVIVFSFFRTTLEKVQRLLGDRCIGPISGSVSPQKRQEIVDAFNAAEPGAVLISQVQAGGTGLNIQAASVIIFCEPQIKPSIENQAIARAYRMGQVRDVLVYRLLADDTVDEQMMEKLRDKQEIFDSFADDSVVGEESLKPSEKTWIADMIKKEQERLAQEENSGI